jgi:hypothetical protein
LLRWRTYENVGPVQLVQESTEPELKLPAAQLWTPTLSSPSLTTSSPAFAVAQKPLLEGEYWPLSQLVQVVSPMPL